MNAFVLWEGLSRQVAVLYVNRTRFRGERVEERFGVKCSCFAWPKAKQRWRGCVSKIDCQAPLLSCRHTLTYRLGFGQLSRGTHQSPRSTATTTVKIVMSDSEVATKAPESDAAEESKNEASLVPGDTPAQSGASLGVGWSFLKYLTLLIFRRSTV